MSRIEPSQLFDRAIELIIKQDEIIQSWAGRYITVQSSFAVAVSAVIAWKGLQPGWAITIVTVLLALVASVLAILMSSVIERHLAWQRAFTESVRFIEGDKPVLYREDMVPEGAGTRLSTFFKVVRYIVPVAWLALVAALLLYQFGTLTAAA